MRPMHGTSLRIRSATALAKMRTSRLRGEPDVGLVWQRTRINREATSVVLCQFLLLVRHCRRATEMTIVDVSAGTRMRGAPLPDIGNAAARVM